MKFFDKMYVGFNRDRYTSTDEQRILGFAVPYDSTQASKKRQETVNNWRQKDIEPRIMDNVPTRGFRLKEVVSRYSTSNKLFRVLDPRGFELEISADNLLELAMNSTIVKGEIVDECVWATSNGVYLMSSSDERYQFYKKSKTDGVPSVEAGNYYVSVGNMISVFRYEGIYHQTYLNLKEIGTKGSMEQFEHGSGYFKSKRKEIFIDELLTKVNIKMNHGGKPFYIYTEFRLDEDGSVASKMIQVRKSKIKNLLPYDNVTQEMKDYNPDMTQWVNVGTRYNYDTNKALDTISYNTSTIFNAYFKKKEDAINFVYSDVIANIPLPLSKNYYSYSNNVDTSPIVGRVDLNYGDEINISENVKRTFEITDER
jgi:hypothetical protein